VIKSRVEGGGEGLVAVKDIQPGTLISFYNGVRFKVRLLLYIDLTISR